MANSYVLSYVYGYETGHNNGTSNHYYGPSPTSSLTYTGTRRAIIVVRGPIQFYVAIKVDSFGHSLLCDGAAGVWPDAGNQGQFRRGLFSPLHQGLSAHRSGGHQL